MYMTYSIKFHRIGILLMII